MQIKSSLIPLFCLLSLPLSGQQKCTVNPCVVVMFNGVQSLAALPSCTLAGTGATATLNCPVSNAVAIKPAIVGTSVLSFVCTNLASISSAAACPPSITVNTPPAGGTMAAGWVGWLPPGTYPFGTFSAGAIHLGISGMTASQFTCGVTTQCYIDNTLTADAPGQEYPVAMVYVPPTTTPAVWQGLTNIWTGAAQMLIVVLPPQ
jgi:hypothetical protein